ncbi:MAG: NUDIX hydrolase [Bacillota bacterium]
MRRKLKVYGYLTRERDGQLQVMVFDHDRSLYPDAGTQVPGGSVEPGESLEEAVVREVFEESGVTATVVRELGSDELPVPESQQLQERHFFLLQTDLPLPDQWVHIVSDGVEDKGMRFHYFWMEVREAAPLLAGNQGCCLPALFPK